MLSTVSLRSLFHPHLRPSASSSSSRFCSASSPASCVNSVGPAASANSVLGVGSPHNCTFALNSVYTFSSPTRLIWSYPTLPQLRQFSCAAPARSAASASASASSSVSPASASSYELPPSFYRTNCGLYVDRSLPRPFDKILIANRGEIAIRIIRTCKELNVKTVAVYSDADRDVLFVKLADEAYHIGGALAKDSYLVGEKLIEVAKRSGAQAIHPGYGFLSENAKFAALIESSGLIFIGPPSSAIESMGSKSASKVIMSAARVPVIPGYHGDNQDVEFLRKEATKIGYPLMIKAVSGGGGKGMRIVENDSVFLEMLASAKREALNSFKDDRVLLERYIKRPRHIEFQIFCDRLGGAVHLFERDCSVQRRHQKVLEEAPAPGMTSALREEMGKAAVNAAKAVGYVGAGTVEFIFDAEKDEYFFMEMNTRLQVEHPVTEMIMKKDLVQWQLHVAAGHPLPVVQSDIKAAHGHAIEARIYAENPYNSFLPCTGRLHHLRPPPTPATASATLPGSDVSIRVESGVREGDEVSIYYDPMIAKLVCWGADRTAALHRMADALRKYRVVGPPTNISFVERCVRHPKFMKGRVETGFIAENHAELLDLRIPRSQSLDAAAIATLFLLLRHSQIQSRANQSSAHSDADGDANSPWKSTGRFRGLVSEATELRWTPIGEGEELSAAEKAEQIKVSAQHKPDSTSANEFQLLFTEHKETKTVQARGTLSDADDSLITCQLGDRIYNAHVVLISTTSNLTASQSTAPAFTEAHVFLDGIHHRLLMPVLNFSRGTHAHAGAVAPMSGRLVTLSVKIGDTVKAGQALASMEAMKMEHIIRAAKEGVVKEVNFQIGDFVEGGKLIIGIESAHKDKEKKK